MPTYMSGAEPFDLPGNQLGCLLIHGFTGTPFEMRSLGLYLSQNYNYRVKGPALAGHGTRVEDCARTTWRDWYSSVFESYTALRKQCDAVYGIGLSLGGALILHLAANEMIDGVVSIAAPISITHPLGPLFRFIPLLHRLVPFLPKDTRESDTQDPSVNSTHPTYDRTPTLAARSLIEGILPTMRSELAKVTTPALLLQGIQDRTIPANSMQSIFDGLGSRDKEMHWLDRSGHLVLEDYAKEEAFHLISDFISRHSQKSAREDAATTVTSVL